MKKLLATVAALATMSTMAFAERYVMITHTQGTDPFWPVVEKAAATQQLLSELTLNITLTLQATCLVWQS